MSLKSLTFVYFFFKLCFLKKKVNKRNQQNPLFRKKSIIYSFFYSLFNQIPFSLRNKGRSSPGDPVILFFVYKKERE